MRLGVLVQGTVCTGCCHAMVLWSCSVVSDPCCACRLSPAGRQEGNLDDLALALQSVAVSLPSLQEYVDSVEQPGCEHKVLCVCVCVCVCVCACVCVCVCTCVHV